MNLAKLLFVAFFLVGAQHLSAQRNYRGYNLLGITGGLSLFDIQTKDLVTNSKEGFIGGFTTRGAFRNDFDLVYGINFQSAKLSVAGKSPLGGAARDLEYSIQGVQINFLGSYNIIVKHLSLEAGPVFSINSKMKLDRSEYGNYILSGYDHLAADEIQDISQFDLRLAGGLTTGLEHFRVNIQYQYGLTNVLGRLNKKGLEKDNFKGNSSTLVLAAIIYF